MEKCAREDDVDDSSGDHFAVLGILTLNYTGSKIARFTRGVRSDPVAKITTFGLRMDFFLCKCIYGQNQETFFNQLFLKLFFDLAFQINVAQRILILDTILCWIKIR